MTVSWFAALLSNAIARIESIRQPAVNWLLGFVFIIFLRVYLEDALTRSGSQAFIASNIFHELLFYLVIFGVAAVVLSYGARVSPDRVLRVIVACSPVILLPLVIDFIVSHGVGFPLSYITNFNSQGFLFRFLTLGGDWQGGGATPGVKIEIVFILAGIACYLWVNTKRIIRTIFSTLIFYCILAILAMLPLWVTWYGQIFGTTIDDYKLPGSKWLLIISIALAVVLLRRMPFGKALLQSLRVSRIVIYLAFVAAGVLYSVNVWGINLPLTTLILHAILVAISVIASSVFLMVVNDQADVAIDRVSNPLRPLPSGTIQPSVYRASGYAALILAGITAAVAGIVPLMLILIGNGLFVIYSVPPFRLRRSFVLGKATIGLGILIVMHAGFLLNTTRCSNIMPFRTIAGVFIAVFIAAFVIDLKDASGDRKAGVPTLPARFGEKRARIITAACILVAFSFLPIILGFPRQSMAGVLLGIMTAVSLFLRPYKEWVTFACFLITLVYFAAAVLLS